VDFLSALNDKYSPTRIIHLGDEIDLHAISFHQSDPDLFSPGHELERAIKLLQPLYRLFPKLDIMESNHGSRVYRKGFASGLPASVLKSNSEIIKAPPGWTWHSELVVETAMGPVMFFHGKTQNALSVSKQLGMSTVNGHFHSQFGIQKWQTPLKINFAMVVGCLIDPKSRAFAYESNNILKPILGAAVIVNGIPKLELMQLKGDGRWTRKI
jgi:hypothetical protein